MKRLVAPLAIGSAVPAWWGPLFERSPDASVYLSEPWIHTWLETYGAEFGGEWVRWERDGEVVGGCLILKRLTRKGPIPLRGLYLNATGESTERTPLAEFNDILCVPAHRAAIAADFAQLLQDEPWDRLYLSGYEQGGFLDAVADELPTAWVRRESRPAVYVDLGALGDGWFHDTLSRNTQAQIRRSRKLYEARSGPLALLPAASLDEALRQFEEMAVLHNAHWQARGFPGSFSSASVVGFHRRILPRLWSTRSVDLLRCVAGDATLGYLYNFKARGKVYSFQSGFAYEEDARLKPGLVTHALAIDHYRRAGLREYDLLAGEARYKRSLGKHERVLDWTVVYRDRAWIRALVWMWLAGQRLRAGSAPR